MDWPAPLFLVCMGSLGVLYATGLFDGEPDAFTRYYGDPFWDSIWFAAVPGSLLILVGVLRLRVTLRRGHRDWL